MMFIVKENSKFSMDVVYECIWILSNYSSTEDIQHQILNIYIAQGETFFFFINECVRMVNQQQASILLTKVLLIIGNVCLESKEFCSRVL